jgi:hypothetical protein
MNIPDLKFKVLYRDEQEYYYNIGKGNITTYYIAELAHGYILKSVFERIEHEDITIVHSESMVFIPK